jgi:hypothetical protein
MYKFRILNMNVTFCTRLDSAVSIETGLKDRMKEELRFDSRYLQQILSSPQHPDWF